MSRLTEHVDLIAIVVLAAVLGLAHPPRIRVGIIPSERRELPDRSMRILKLQKPVYTPPGMR